MEKKHHQERVSLVSTNPDPALSFGKLNLLFWNSIDTSLAALAASVFWHSHCRPPLPPSPALDFRVWSTNRSSRLPLLPHLPQHRQSEQLTYRTAHSTLYSRTSDDPLLPTEQIPDIKDSSCLRCSTHTMATRATLKC